MRFCVLIMYRLLSILFLSWIVGGVVFFPSYIKVETRSRCPKTDTVDAIVVFTGGGRRLRVARSLHRKSPQKKMHISGVGWKNTCPMHQTVSWDSAKNTWENIVLTEKWMRQEKIHSVQLVTSDYHMPRCLLLAQFLWADITVRPCIVNTADTHSFPFLFFEYNKFLGSCFFLLSHKFFS